MMKNIPEAVLLEPEEMIEDIELFLVADQLGCPLSAVYVGGSWYAIPPTQREWLALKRVFKQNGKSGVLLRYAIMNGWQMLVDSFGAQLSYPRVLDYDTQCWIIEQAGEKSWDFAMRNRHAWEYLSEFADRNVILFRTEQPTEPERFGLVVDEREVMELYRECGYPRLWVYAEKCNLLFATRDVKRIEQFVLDGNGGWLLEQLKKRERVYTPYIRALERTIAELKGTPFAGSPIADWLDYNPDWYLYESTVRTLQGVLQSLKQEKRLLDNPASSDEAGNDNR